MHYETSFPKQRNFIELSIIELSIKITIFAKNQSDGNESFLYYIRYPGAILL